MSPGLRPAALLFRLLQLDQFLLQLRDSNELRPLLSLEHANAFLGGLDACAEWFQFRLEVFDPPFTAVVLTPFLRAPPLGVRFAHATITAISAPYGPVSEGVSSPP